MNKIGNNQSVNNETMNNETGQVYSIKDSKHALQFQDLGNMVWQNGAERIMTTLMVEDAETKEK